MESNKPQQPSSNGTKPKQLQPQARAQGRGRGRQAESPLSVEQQLEAMRKELARIKIEKEREKERGEIERERARKRISQLEDDNWFYQQENADLKTYKSFVQKTAAAALDRSWIEDTVRCWRTKFVPVMKEKPSGYNWRNSSWTDQHQKGDAFIHSDRSFLDALQRETSNGSFNPPLHRKFEDMFIEIYGRTPSPRELQRFESDTIKDIKDLRCDTDIYSALSTLLHHCVPSNQEPERDQILAAARTTLNPAMTALAERLLNDCYTVKKCLEKL